MTKTQLPPPIQHPKCSKCGTLLFKVRLVPGVWIEYKCHRCNTINVIERKAA